MTDTTYAVVADAIAILARRRLHQRQQQTDLPPVVSHDRWLARTETELRAKYAETMNHLDLSVYNGEQLADRLEHGAPRPATKHGWHTTRRPACGNCDGNNWIPAPSQQANGTTYQYVTPCPTCTNTPA